MDTSEREKLEEARRLREVGRGFVKGKVRASRDDWRKCADVYEQALTVLLGPGPEAVHLMEAGQPQEDS